MNEGLTNEGLKREMYGAGLRASYDEHAKRLLAQKIVLAHILVNAVSEFKGMEPEDAVFLIENEPAISSVPVDPGEARPPVQTAAGEIWREPMPAITGRNTESQIPYEGKVTYDIHFFAWTPGKKERVKYQQMKKRTYYHRSLKFNWTPVGRGDLILCVI